MGASGAERKARRSKREARCVVMRWPMEQKKNPGSCPAAWSALSPKGRRYAGTPHDHRSRHRFDHHRHRSRRARVWSPTNSPRDLVKAALAQLHAHVTRVSRHGRTHRQTLRRRRAHARMSSPSPSSEARRKRGVCARATRGDETEKFGRFGVRGGTSSGRHAQTWRLSGVAESGTARSRLPRKK